MPGIIYLIVNWRIIVLIKLDNSKLAQSAMPTLPQLITLLGLLGFSIEGIGYDYWLMVPGIASQLLTM